MAQDAFEGSIASIGSGSGTAAPSTEPKLTYFAYSLRRVFKGYNVQVSLDSARDYKVFICEDNSVPRTTYNQQTTITSFVTAKKRILNYWAFSPGIAMEELRELQVRSIILTSGTLSPLDSFKEDLKIPFLVELTNPHVIQKNQIWVGALPFGPSGKILNSSYNMRGKNEYKDELGMAVLSICETSRGFSFNNSRTYGGLVVPTGPDMKGGLLVFFPSYSVMENTVDRWKETNIFEKLESICCAVIIEPKGSSSANTRSQLTQKQSNSGQSSSSFNENKNWGASKKLSYEDDSATAKKAKVSFTSGPSKSTLPPGVGDADKEGQVAMGALIADFDAALAKHGNCMLMAVCRGKVSEGIDFSDSRGRVVIITGLPYTPFQDPWVVLKRQFLDESCFQQPSVQVAIPNTYAGYAQAVGSGSGSMGLLSMGQTKTTANPATGFRSAIRRLNGEAWYAQSASRAVNQAIGRVIRHKNDWGAIFFLDDRFVRSQQQAQLSGWVRPSTQNYEKISDALRNYRDFVNAALANPLLTIKPRVDVSALPKVDRRPLPPHKQHVDPAKEEESSAALTELFPQEVILRQDKLMQSSQFNSSDDNYFVNVDLLSQQVSSATPARCLPRNPVEELDGFLSKLSQSKVRSSLSRNGNIGVNTSGSLIAGKLTKSPKKSSIAHIFSVPASVKSTTASSSSSSDTVRRNLGHSNPRSTGGVSLYNLQGSSTSLSGRLSGASSGSFGLSSQSQNSLPSTLSQQSKPSSSESASQTQLPVKKQSFTLPTFERKQVLSIEQILQRTFGMYIKIIVNIFFRNYQ